MLSLDVNCPGTLVRIEQVIAAGAARLVPTPPQQGFFQARKQKTLLRLEMLAVGRAAR